MLRPQRLRLAVQGDLLEWRAAGMRAGERDVPARMPVLRGHRVAEAALAQQGVNARHDQVAFVAGQAAAGHEVGLHVDQDQRGVGGGKLAHGVTVRGRPGQSSVRAARRCHDP
jgi:hypothetical protein